MPPDGWASRSPRSAICEGCEPSTSCLVCLVKVGGERAGWCRPAPRRPPRAWRSRARRDEVRQARRTAPGTAPERPPGRLPGALLVRLPGRDGHPADAPADRRAATCAGAIATVKARHRPAGRAGPHLPRPVREGLPPGQLDGAVAICLLKRFVADADLASAEPYPAARARPATRQAGGHRRRRADRAGRRLLPRRSGPRLHDLRGGRAARRPAARRAAEHAAPRGAGRRDRADHPPGAGWASSRGWAAAWDATWRWPSSTSSSTPC